jgi:Zn-finger nucleic acid-binding protein
MQCPVCTDETLVISSREGIEIDHCPQCRGVWLDRGELDKIIERAAPSVLGASAAPAPEPVPPRHDFEQGRDRDRYDDRYRYEKKRRRKNFLEELFDFD